MLRSFYKLGFKREHLAHPLFKYSLRGLVRMGLVPASKLWGIPIQEVFKIPVQPGTSVLYSVTPDDAIGLEIYWKGLRCFEPELVPIFLEAARTADGVLDVGAHRGIYGIFACAVNPGVQVICAEPVPALWEATRANAALNGFANRCTAARCAVGDQIAKTRFYLPGDHTMGSLEESVYPHLQRTVLEVDVTTVDALVPAGMKIDVVKIDVEGSEDKVLRGMTRLMAECRPTIFFECIPQGPNGAVRAILEEFGYRFYHLEPDRAVPVNDLTPPTTSKLYNFMATADQRSGRKVNAIISAAHS